MNAWCIPGQLNIKCPLIDYDVYIMNLAIFNVILQENLHIYEDETLPWINVFTFSFISYTWHYLSNIIIKMDTNDNGYLYHYYRCLYLYIKCSVKLHNELKTDNKRGSCGDIKLVSIIISK